MFTVLTADMGTRKTLTAALVLMASVVKGNIDIDRLTTAIGEVESGMDHAAVGDRAKALGAWQMHSAAWHDANVWRKARGLKTYPRSSWRNPVVSKAMAKAYIEMIAARLDSMGRPVTPATIYLAYTVGVTAYLRDGIDAASAEKVDAANRVHNIYTKRK